MPMQFTPTSQPNQRPPSIVGEHDAPLVAKPVCVLTTPAGLAPPKPEALVKVGDPMHAERSTPYVDDIAPLENPPKKFVVVTARPATLPVP